MTLITALSLVPGTASLGMQYHKLTEHFDEKPFSCEECGAKFAANSTLKNHLRLHTGDRPFVCKHCLMTFTQASALAYHTKKKHSEGEAWRMFFLLQTKLCELPENPLAVRPDLGTLSRLKARRNVKSPGTQSRNTCAQAWKCSRGEFLQRLSSVVLTLWL